MHAFLKIGLCGFAFTAVAANATSTLRAQYRIGIDPIIYASGGSAEFVDAQTGLTVTLPNAVFIGSPYLYTAEYDIDADGVANPSFVSGSLLLDGVARFVNDTNRKTVNRIGFLSVVQNINYSYFDDPAEPRIGLRCGICVGPSAALQIDYLGSDKPTRFVGPRNGNTASGPILIWASFNLAPGESALVDFSASLQTAAFFGPVPEPQTWTMLIAGFGLVGCVARRRQARGSPPRIA